MAGTAHLVKQRALAQQEAIAVVGRLLGEDSARLYSATHDVAGRTDPAFVMSMLAAETARVLEGQEERIRALEEALKASK